MSRFFPDKNKSQIIFDITGCENSYKTMNLTTLPKETKIIRNKNENYFMRTDDIDGASYKPDRRPTRDLSLNISDIPGTQPKPSYNKFKPPFDIMSVDDIDGAKPRINWNLPHSNRHTNPQNPVYKMPTKPEEPAPEVKFVYDGFNFDDIPGVHPKSYKTDKPPRDIFKVDDLPGAKPKISTTKFDPQNRILDVSDINNDGLFHTRRRLDPQNPEYNYDGKILKADFGRAKTNYKHRNNDDFKETDFSLKTSDIPGAKADSQTQWYRNFRRPKVTNEEDDSIEGSTLMLPSMKKQTAELERQRALYKMRGERIQKFENRCVNHESNHVDNVQYLLRQQRNSPVKRARTNMRPRKIVL